MILVDTSVWIDHLRAGDAALSELLDSGQVFAHPFVVGELACGNLRQRTEILTSLAHLPSVPSSSDAEVRFLIESRALMGRGLGYIDMHLLASTLLVDEARLWTRDRRLRAVAEELRVSANLSP
ncbi:MAG: putative nucleic acid-binding protein [Gammaproteobacteria bacterium]|jgi:predicted nucleic acid-binding protein